MENPSTKLGTSKLEIAVFGGGCFWCTEAVFKMLKGVKSVIPGYAGGHKENPAYEEVSAGVTGHAEVIKIEFDTSQVTYESLLTVFFATHDPTTKDRQGNDVGPQYRSIILYSSEEQRLSAEKMILDINTSTAAGAPIVTEVKRLEKFYEAEDYHKNYYAKNSSMPYCELVINPKLDKVRKSFSALLAASAS